MKQSEWIQRCTVAGWNLPSVKLYCAMIGLTGGIMDTIKIEKAIAAAVEKAVRKVGIDAIRNSSLCLSNSREVVTKAA